MVTELLALVDVGDVTLNHRQAGALDGVVQSGRIESTHLKRYATLAEQAAPILFLASDEASYIVGSTLPVGGGDLG